VLPVRALLQRHWPILALLSFFAILYSTAIGAYPMFMWDEAEYATLSRSIVNGHGFAISDVPKPLRPPVLPLAGAASMLLTREQFDDNALRASEIPFALLALMAVYAFAAVDRNRTTGFLAAALLGVMPLFWISVPLFMSEIPFLVSFAAAVWFFQFGLYRDRRFLLWSWIALALAMLTRYTALLFAPFAAIAIPLAWWLGGPAARRRILSRTFFLAPFTGLLVFLPWLIRQYVTFGSPLAGFKLASQQLQTYIPGLSIPWYFYFKNLPAFLSPPVALLCVAGIAWSLWKRHPFGLHTLAAAALILIWFSFYRYKEERIISSALPFLAVLAALPLARLAGHLRRTLFGVLVATLLIGNFFVSWRMTRYVFENAAVLGYPSFLDAMAFLRANASSEDTVLGANYPQINWYSGLRAYDFPDESNLMPALRRSQWVVVTNFERGQKPYVARFADAVPIGVSGNAAAFRDSRFLTIVIRSKSLIEALGK